MPSGKGAGAAVDSGAAGGGGASVRTSAGTGAKGGGALSGKGLTMAYKRAK